MGSGINQEKWKKGERGKWGRGGGIKGGGGRGERAGLVIRGVNGVGEGGLCSGNVLDWRGYVVEGYTVGSEAAGQCSKGGGGGLKYSGRLWGRGLGVKRSGVGEQL
jgi:hypothetical protein